MRKLGLVVLVAATTLLVGCGSTKTVTVTAPTQSGSPSTGTSGGGASVNASAAENCFKAAGAAVRVRPAGQGTAVYAVTRDSGNIGVLKGPNASIATAIARAFANGGVWKPKPVKGDPLAYSIYQGALTSADSALLSKCAK